MFHIKHITGLALITFLIGCSSAFAQAPVPLASSQASADIAIAKAFWHQTATCATPMFVLRNAEMIAYVGKVAAGATSLGCATPTVSPIYTQGTDYYPANKTGRVARCNDIVHEYGHTLGYTHDFVPMSVMNASDDSIVYGCFTRYIGRGHRAHIWRDNHPFSGWAVRPDRTSPTYRADLS